MNRSSPNAPSTKCTCPRARHTHRLLAPFLVARIRLVQSGYIKQYAGLLCYEKVCYLLWRLDCCILFAPKLAFLGFFDIGTERHMLGQEGKQAGTEHVRNVEKFEVSVQSRIGFQQLSNCSKGKTALI